MSAQAGKYICTHAWFAPASRASLQRGLSLIELMISITIGLLILASLSTLFANQSKTRAELDKSNRMIDNGRYALDTLSSDLRMAGFYGEFIPRPATSGVAAVPPLPTTLPDPCTTDPAGISAALQFAVQGYDAANSTSAISSPPCGLTYTPGNDKSLKNGSDILVIRRAGTTSIAPGEGLDGTHYIQASLCRYDPAGTPFVIDKSISSFTLRKKECLSTTTTPLADLRNMMVHVYYVSPSNTPGDGIPTLKRLELDSDTHDFVVRPLVEGVDHFQVEYGMDTTNDGMADSYVTAPSATAWNNVVATKVYILARNNESTKGHTETKSYSLGQAGSVTPNDSYKRHAYTQFIRLVNPAGRRE